MGESAADLRSQARLLEQERDELADLLKVHDRALPNAVREVTVGLRREGEVEKLVRQRADLQSKVAALANRIKVLIIAADEANAEELARLTAERRGEALRRFVEWNEARKEALRLWSVFTDTKASVPGGFNMPLLSDEATAEWAASQLRSMEALLPPLPVSSPSLRPGDRTAFAPSPSGSLAGVGP